MSALRAIVAASTLLAGMAMGPAATAQSMNAPLIVREVVGGVCAPLMRSGDVETAVAAAEALGYRHTVEPWNLMDRSSPSARAILNKSHAGTVTISLDYGRVLCSVGIHEAGAARLSDLAAPFLAELGLTLALDARDAGGPQAAVWRGDRMQAVISPSPVFQPGAEITLTAHFD